MKNFFVVFCLILSFCAKAQEVQKDFTKTLLSEDFDAVSDKWPQVFNADNLFLTQDSHYELFRKSKKNGYYLLPKSDDEFSGFEVTTKFIFDEAGNKKQSAGLILMAQKSGNGAIVIEVSRKKEYRIKRLYTDRTANISAGNDGWERSIYISKDINEISVKTYQKVYDLYINGQFIRTFSEIEFSKGNVGLYIGPNSKARFDYLKVRGEDKLTLTETEVTTKKEEEESFTQIIIRLKDQINSKNKEIDDLKNQLRNCDRGNHTPGTIDTASIRIRRELEQKVLKLSNENERLQIDLARTMVEKDKLEKFKKEIESNQNDGDIIINLTNMVNTQKGKLEEAEKKNKELNAENNSLFLETKELTAKLEKNNLMLAEQLAMNNGLKTENDSLKRMILQMQDSLKQAKTQKLNTPENEESDAEKLNRLIEQERQERLRRREEEERKKKEEEEKQNGNGG